MAQALPHPVIALLASLRQECIRLESDIQEMNRKARRTPMDYSSYSAVRKDRARLAAEVHQMKRKVHRTPFDYLGYSAEVQFVLRTVVVRENKIDEQIRHACESIDCALIKLPLIRVKIRELESEISRNSIESYQQLTFSRVLRPGPSTGTPTGFLDLPAELRNYVYELSGCLTYSKCGSCTQRFDPLAAFRKDRRSRPAPM